MQRTQADPSRTAAEAIKPPTYQNHNTHWWDGSQLYGSSKESSDKIRSFVDGRLKVNADNSLPTELLSGKPVTGVNDNWWLGLSMLHQLFTLEHNAIAGKLKQAYPAQTDQWIYDHARLANAALMDDTPLVNLLADDPRQAVTTMGPGLITVTVPAQSVMVLQPVERDLGGYSRYKRVR